MSGSVPVVVTSPTPEQRGREVTNANLEAALTYARRSWHVLPLAAGDKAPAIPKEQGGSGYKDATTDESTIREWWRRWPNAGVGIACGPESGLCVLDVDLKSGGHRALEALIEVHGPLPETPRVATAGGGAHYYFAFRDGIKRCTLAPGLELKPLGGYLVAPPTKLVHGGVYRWVAEWPSVALAELPSWLEPPKREARKAPDATLPDRIVAGERNHTLFSMAGAMRRKGMGRDAIRAALGVENEKHCDPPLDAPELDKIADSVERYAPGASARGDAKSNPWDAACDVHDFVSSVEADVDFLIENIIARGAITSWYSPRGLGKTLVAHWIAVDIARRGFTVLLIDRDNSRREVRRRLRAWGLNDVARDRLHVITRDEAPPLTDVAAWKQFPVAKYDLVIVDSFDSSAEGVGEQDSTKSSLAIAALLDVVRGTKGPGALVLGNVIKSGAHGRGSGVIEDRADIVFEIRDATGFRPTGTKDWWLELPAAGRADWASRASRRKRRASYRLAFIPSKFRVGEEPDPFAFEVGCAAEPWTCRDVSKQLVSDGLEARDEAIRNVARTRDEARAALAAEVLTLGQMHKRDEAVTFLVDRFGLSRRAARDLIDDGAGTCWRITGSGTKSRPYLLQPPSVNEADGHHEVPLPPLPIAGETGSILADRINTARPESQLTDPARPAVANGVPHSGRDSATDGAEARRPALSDLLKSFDWEPVDPPNRVPETAH